MAPADYNELNSMLEFAVNNFNGPIALRYPRGSSSMAISNSNKEIEIGKGLIVNEGDDLTIIAYSHMVEVAIDIAEKLKKENISVEVINLRFLKPLDNNLILKSATKTNKVLIIEETSNEAGMCHKINGLLPKDIDVLVKTFPDIFIKHGNPNDIYKKYGFDSDSLIKNIKVRFKF